MRSSNPKFRRVRPLLGTFVEINLSGIAQKRMDASATRAFEAIGEIDRLMSFHRATSDLSRLNRAPANEWLFVHRHTRNVFAKANQLFETSRGVFDVRRDAEMDGERGFAPVEISGRRIRKTGSFTFDLGGIAKGYAVDLAVNILKRSGLESGLVNAGGDLRAFGSEAWPIAVRHPSCPGAARAVFPLKSGALATSGAYFSSRHENRKWISALNRSSISVIAPTCMVADGLTKVVAFAPKDAARALRRFRAHAFVISADGAVRGVN